MTPVAPESNARRLMLRGVSEVLDADDSQEGPIDVLLTGGTITAIGRDLPDEVETILDCRGQLLAPGLINAHWHSPMQPAHGTADRLDHKRFMWANQADTAGRSAEEIGLAALLGCIQMIRSGTTGVMDHFPEQGFGPDDVQAVLRAYATSGMRAVVGLRVFDGEYTDIMPEAGQRSAALDRAIAEHNPLRPAPAQQTLALLEECLTRFDRQSPRLRVFPAPSNPMRCSDDFLQAVQALAVRHDTGVHCHLLETRRQAEIASARYGRTLVAHLAMLGTLDARWSCAHCNWLSPADITLMAERGVVAVLNPESNLKLGSGVPPVPHLVAGGVTCALGTDGASTNDNLILQEAMQLAALLHRTDEPDHARWTSALDVFRMASTGGAAALREPLLGRVRVGWKADLVLYDLDSPAWIPLNDPLQQFVFGERGAGVRRVIIDGNLVMDQARILCFDEEAVLGEVRHLLRDTRARNPGIQRIAQEFS
jgi:5-methylthioadenosine/S-adenosylhomocysteine deaminase